ncbi:hypothetical protein ACFYNO_07435 [Kitasatospora sp. NPDC006697]|uniref:hypothetical protein n=1 Tax=Kitasatospora sp. NPDC006697 TaxID=3364020 RepID=UPI00369DBA23
MDDVLQHLDQMDSRLQHLKQLALEARAAMSSRSEGRDHSETVLVVQGSDQLPESITIAHGWQLRLSARELNDSVREAARAAAIRQIEVWHEAPDSAAWLDATRQRGAESAQVLMDTDLQRQADSFSTAPPRPVEELVEDLLKAVAEPGEMEAPSGLGEAADGRVALRISRYGLTSCEIDDRWATNQNASELTRALQHALAEARNDLRRSMSDRRAARAGGTDALLAETLSLLTTPGRLLEATERRGTS